MTVVLAIVASALAGVFGAMAWRLARAEDRRSAARVAALSAALDATTVTPAMRPVDVPPGFLVQRRTAAGAGVIKIAAGFAVVVAAIVAVAILEPGRRGAETPAAAAASLELLSMRHQQEGDTLTVTGLVRNGGEVAADGVTAVVLAFDRSGQFIASGRAPLDFRSLSPGDESPFRVAVPGGANIGRYRVSFRTEAGVVRHLDRRQALLARQGE